jgi:hypothetical protein
MLLSTGDTLFLLHRLRIVQHTCSMEWSMLISTRTHLSCHWRFSVATWAQIEEVCSHTSLGFHDLNSATSSVRGFLFALVIFNHNQSSYMTVLELSYALLCFSLEGCKSQMFCIEPHVLRSLFHMMPVWTEVNICCLDIFENQAQNRIVLSVLDKCALLNWNNNIYSYLIRKKVRFSQLDRVVLVFWIHKDALLQIQDLSRKKNYA